MKSLSRLGRNRQSGDIREVTLADLGPVTFAESRLSARTRFHQAWYRAAVLHIDSYGTSKHLRVDVPRGSILPDSAVLDGKNFVSVDAEYLYQERRALGWGLDPTRCTAYLTSSQALTLNVFAPLMRDPAWFATVLTEVLVTPISNISQAHIEHAPSRPSQALGDRTMLDLWLMATTTDGRNLSIAFEVKYSDRFSSRVLPIWASSRYRELAHSQHPPLWDLDAPATRSRSINQLIRCHALAAHLGQSLQATNSHLVVVHQPADSVAAAVINEFRSLVGDDTLRSCDLKALLDAMANSASTKQLQTVERLRVRYAANELSEDLWLRHGGSQKDLSLSRDGLSI